MATDKAPYKLTIKLDSARPDALGEALRVLRDIAGEYDQTGEGAASITIESWQEKPLQGICDDFEEWLFKHQIGLGCEMGIKRPGLRPEMVSVLRARHATPMDRQGWEDDEQADEADARPIIIAPLLALPAPCETLELDIDEADLVEE